MICNPFTRQLLILNVKGCNQYTGKNCHLGEKISSKLKSSPALRRFSERLVKSEKELKNPIVRSLAKVGRFTGLTQAAERLIGSKATHATWTDRRTGYKYDFRPAKGVGLTSYVDSRLTETSPSGKTVELSGPKYNLIKRNCHDANVFLPQYIRKFNRMRRKERKREKSS